MQDKTNVIPFILTEEQVRLNNHYGDNRNDDKDIIKENLLIDIDVLKLVSACIYGTLLFMFVFVCLIVKVMQLIGTTNLKVISDVCVPFGGIFVIASLVFIIWCFVVKYKNKKYKKVIK